MTSQRRITFLAVVLSFSMGLGQLGESVYGQAQDQKITTREPTEPTISIEFEGGTIPEYVATIKEAAKDINIVVKLEAQEVSLPLISLKGVSLDSALYLIPDAAKQSHTVVIEEISKNLFVVKAFPRHTKPTKRTQVLSIRQLTEGLPGDPENAGLKLKLETVLTAIDAVLNSRSSMDREKPAMKLHSDSGLLILHGTTSQLKAVSEVVYTMMNDMQDRRRYLGRDSQKLHKELRNNLEKMKKQIEELRKEVAELKKARK